MRTSASQRLREIAGSDPARPAVVGEGISWTYAGLDAAVDQLASWLRQQLPRDGDREVVALRYRTTVPMILTSVAVTRAGLVGVLVDPTAPGERVDALLQDLTTTGAAPLLLTDNPDDLERHPGSVLLDTARAEEPGSPLPGTAERGPDELQSVIYTSGSTGVPSGLASSGRQRDALVDWIVATGAAREGTRLGFVTAGTLGQASLFPHAVLATGGTMVVHDVLVHGLDGVPRWLRDHRVEVTGLVPTLVRFLLPLLDAELGSEGVLADLRTVVVWGEPAEWPDVAGLLRHLPAGAVVHNAYGTTETGMVAAHQVTAEDVVGSPAGRVPAGRAWPGVRVHVVDADGDDVPVGEEGEIVVASRHLSLGHWRRPDLEASTFAVRPDGVRVCRTGDGGRVDGDGVLHVTGRLDDVVKVSGYRVALGELELAARAQPSVAAAAATSRSDAGGAVRLHLYVVPSPGATVEPRWLRVELARVLPPHELPDTVDVLDALPLLGSGKVDRRSLPEPTGRGATAEPADGGLVPQLRELFAEVLGVPDVGPDDDFFELGGDSLRAGRAVALVQTRLGHYVPASVVIEAPTARSLAAALRVGDGSSVVVPVRTTGPGAPLFVVSGAAGEVFFARAVARHLEPAGPVYGLQPPPLVGPEPFAASLLEIARHYVAQVRKVRPTGPYRLYGYSMGGLIAFEMATLLQDEGAEVELLALGDTSVPEGVVERWAAAREREERERAGRGVLGRITEQVAHRRAQLAHRVSGQERITEQWRRFEAGAEPGPDIRADAYRRVYGSLVVDHQVRTPFRGDLLVVVAARESTAADEGWGRHVTGRVRRVEVDGSHDHLMGGATVAAVAAALSARG